MKWKNIVPLIEIQEVIYSLVQIVPCVFAGKEKKGKRGINFAHKG